MKILTVVGARPQFIKAAAVSRVLAERDGVTECLVHTGQHYDPAMSEVFFEELEIPNPDHHLGVGSGTHAIQTARMLEGLEPLLVDERPDWLLIYGDTNSTLAGAIAAAKLHVPIAHVEAGLRSFNRAMPEEINRIVADQCSDLLFPPTRAAVENLEREGFDPARIHRVGDVMYDVALHAARRAEARSRILETLALEPRGFVLATIHRAENTDAPENLAAIFGALAALADDRPVVLPLHPRTRGALEQRAELKPAAERLRLIEPVGYLDMVQLERHAALVVTDSGGVQKEAFFHRVPCVTLRTETEWVELVESGWNRLAPPPDVAAMAAALRSGLASAADVAARPSPDFYGDGHAAEKIVDVLTKRDPA